VHCLVWEYEDIGVNPCSVEVRGEERVREEVGNFGRGDVGTGGMLDDIGFVVCTWDGWWDDNGIVRMR